MNFMQKWMTQIQAQLQNLTLSQKLLVGTLAVMIPMMMWIVWQYAAEPEMVPLLRGQTIAEDKRGQIIDYLEGREIPYRQSGDQILVPRERSMHLLASLSMKGALPADTSAGFDAIARETSWWESNAQGERRYTIAVQKVLGAVLRNMPWVQDATVIISRPQRIAGFGPTHQHPTASVNLVTAGEPLNQRRVDAVAALVSGAVAEMRVQDVTVIDAQVGRQWTIRDDQTMLASDYMEAVQKQESYYRTKIGEVFNYIPKVIVAVNVEVDLRKSRTDKVSYDKKASTELLIRQRSQSTESKGGGDGGEPAVRSNVAADIAGAGGGGTNSTSDESESEFSTHPGREQVISEDPGGMPTRISATVNIPRSFFVARYRMGAGADAEEPTDEVLKPIADPYIARFKKQVENLVATKTPGEVVVDMYPDQLAPA
ncbi:MAG: hypothetical protein OER86_05145, partial [Phycisphaerae bacterium]|nr:hypothetical protein [Phycisphaerae bacterium]